MSKWDVFFIDMCKLCASMSKDPSTKVGAVLVAPNKTVVSTGWNGFPRGLDDSPELYADRDYKLAVVVHAEENAILMAHGSTEGCTIYVSSLCPCAHCASLIIQSGIARVVAELREIPERWRVNMAIALRNLITAGVAVEFIDVAEDRLYRASITPIDTFLLVSADRAHMRSF